MSSIKPALKRLRLPTTSIPPTPTPTISTVHRGLAFEKRSLRLLSACLSMALRHVGGKSDGGVDLQGWWWVPTSAPPPPAHSHSKGGAGEERLMMPRKRVRVFAQCKAEKKKLGPGYVRELEGVLHRHRASSGSFSSSVFPPPLPPPPPQQQQQQQQQPGAGGGGLEGGEHEGEGEGDMETEMVGVLISQSAFTKSAILHAGSSAVPFLLLHIPALLNLDASNADGEVGSIVFNHALSGPEGPLRGEIEARWERSLHAVEGRPGLWWQGRRIPSWVPDGDSEAHLLRH